MSSVAIFDKLILNGTKQAIPPFLYGTAWKKERTADLVHQALCCGFCGVDTAAQPKHYREDLVGVGLRQAMSDGKISRANLFVSVLTPEHGRPLRSTPGRIPNVVRGPKFWLSTERAYDEDIIPPVLHVTVHSYPSSSDKSIERQEDNEDEKAIIAIFAFSIIQASHTQRSLYRILLFQIPVHQPLLLCFIQSRVLALC